MTNSRADLGLRVFIASPGDVVDERRLARQVLGQLPYDPLVRGRLTIETVAWDQPGGGTPMYATMTPQAAITAGLPRPSECDVVVAVLWSRMGTPLPAEYVKPDGTRYASGTEWEFLDAVAGHASSGRPDVLLYRRTEALKVDVNSVYQRVESLSGGRQQSVAIARAISFEPRVVILDEPTANLSVMATDRLLETMLELKKHGVAQIIISHRLVDIFAVGDRVMVLKRGENVGERYIKNTDEHEVLEIIVSGTRESRLSADEALARAA